MIDPATIQAVEGFAEVLIAAVPKLVELFKHAGRDGVLVGLDGLLTVARAKTDADLASKHRDDPTT